MVVLEGYIIIFYILFKRFMKGFDEIKIFIEISFITELVNH